MCSSRLFACVASTITLLMVFAAGCGPLPGPLPPHVGDDNPDTPGTWAVGHFLFEATDSARDNRTLKVDVWYPVDSEDATFGGYRTYPMLWWLGITSDLAIANAAVSAVEDRTLIVFSHGYRSNSIQSAPLMETLASHGFIVVSPEHTGNAQVSPTDTWDEAAAKRVPDVSFIIDTMITRSNDPGDVFYGRIDESAFGVTGHSFGGHTSMGMVVGWAGADPDPRVAAVAPISGQMDLFEVDLPSVNVPVMLLGGTLDTAVPITQNDLGFSLIPAPVYQADVIGATHTHFANICAIAKFLIVDLGIRMELWPLVGAEALIEPYLETCSPEALPIDEAHRLQNLYVVAFFKRHLLGLTDYDLYLTQAYTDANEPNASFKAK